MQGYSASIVENGLLTMFRKPTDFDPATPNPEIDLSAEDEGLLQKLRQENSGDMVFDPVGEAPTSTDLPIARQTSGCIRPHTRYLITSKDFDIFAEMQGAVCKHVRLGRFPGPIILPGPSYKKLIWDRLTTKPFNGYYPFMIDRMEIPFRLPVWLDSQYQAGLILPDNVILCIIP